MKVTKNEFLEMLKYTEPSYISRLLRNGLIVADTDGLIDLENPINKKWVKRRSAKLAKKPENDKFNSDKLFKTRVVMSTKHLQEYDLSLKAKGLMTVFLALPEDWEYSIENIMAICKENKWGIKSTIRELKKSGYLSVTTGRNDNGYFNSIYDIYENPKDNPLFNTTNQ